MYNIHNHYRNILNFASNIVTEPTVLYLHPFGSTGTENLEILAVKTRRGPILLCYDQEPLLPSFNDQLFDYVIKTHKWVNGFARFDFSDHNPIILLNTELDSDDKNQILSKFNFIDCYGFFHVFAAADWFRGYQFDSSIVSPEKRTIRKTYITFNRLTSNARVYRSLWINELIEHNIMDQGHVSFSIDCPDGGHYAQNLKRNAAAFNIPQEIVDKAISNIDSLEVEPRIDTDSGPIPNGSYELGAMAASQESFLYVVTETCFWGRKKHLTEKVFKPIVEKMPFLLLAPAHNLEYLRSYGFKTFSDFWDESYDQEEDDIKRLQMIGDLLKQICSYSSEELEDMLTRMQPILEHNHKIFFNGDVLNLAWAELSANLAEALKACPEPINEKFSLESDDFEQKFLEMVKMYPDRLIKNKP